MNLDRFLTRTKDVALLIASLYGFVLATNAIFTAPKRLEACEIKIQNQGTIITKLEIDILYIKESIIEQREMSRMILKKLDQNRRNL